MPQASHPLDLLVRKLTTHVSLTEADRAVILDLPYERRPFPPSSYLVREGDMPKFCAVLINGFAYRQKLTSEGARQIVSIHIPGEPLDFQNLFLEIADHDVLTLTRADVAIVPRNAIRKLARERPGIAHAVLISTLVDASIFREWVLNVGRRDAVTSVAHLLCEFALRLDAQGLANDYGYILPMTQEQIGDCVGLTAVHVNRTLRLLEEAGLIERDGRKILFPRWRELQNVADFNERYLHLMLQPA